MLGVSIASANAAVEVWLTIPAGTPAQVQTQANASVSLHVTGRPTTIYSVLTVGAGYTLNCEGGTNNPRKADLVATIANPALNSTHGILKSSTFAIAGFNQWEVGEDHLCVVDYRGRAAGGASGAGVSGSGFDFVLTGSGLDQATDTDTQSFIMRRYTGDCVAGGGTCCIP